MHRLCASYPDFCGWEALVFRGEQIVARFMNPIAARTRRMNMLPNHKTKLAGELLPSK